MKKSFNMPDIGEGVVEGEVIAWLKNVGDKIGKDEPVIVLMTDKATVELPSPYVGTLTKQFYQVGDKAKKGLPLFEIEQEGGEETVAEKKKVTAPAIKPKAIKQTGKVLASPPVRKLAKEMGIPLEDVTGTGEGGVITRKDLKTQDHKTPITHLEGDTETPVRGIKNLMAEKMAESKHAIPHFSFFEQADATRLVKLKEKMAIEAKAKNISLTYMPFFIKALSLVLHKHPELNSALDLAHHTLVTHHVHNIGIAMSTENGLIVPVLKGVEHMHLHEIIYAYESLKEKSKNNKLTPSDMKEATCTITNFGALGNSGVFATPIINYPETAILGVGRIVKLPKAVDDKIISSDMLNCSWSFDHRVIDGNLATRASHDFVHLIQNPAQLL